MKFFSKIILLLLVIFIILYPILPSFGMYNCDLIIVVLGILQFINLILKSKKSITINNIKHFFKTNYILCSLILFNISMYLSIFIANNKKTALGNSIKFSMYIFVFYLITYYITNKKTFSLLTNTFIFSSLIISVITIFQTISAYNHGILISEDNRIKSLLENSNNLGAFSVLAMFLVLGYFFKTKKLYLKLFYLIIFILQLLNIIACQSRNALLAAIIGGFILAILYDKRYFVFSIILPIVLLIIPQSRLRILEVFDFSQNNSRIKLWETALCMIKDHPITGIGYENFRLLYPEYIERYPDLKIWYIYEPYHAHNIFLKVQSELGIIGTITFLLFIFSFLFMFYKLIKSTNNKSAKILCISLLSAVLSFNFMNLIDCFYNSPKIIITFLIILGFANGYYKLHNSNNEFNNSIY